MGDDLPPHDLADLLADAKSWKRSYHAGEGNYANMLTASGVIGHFDEMTRWLAAEVERLRAALAPHQAPLFEGPARAWRLHALADTDSPVRVLPLCETCRGRGLVPATGRGGDGYEPCPDCCDCRGGTDGVVTDPQLEAVPDAWIDELNTVPSRDAASFDPQWDEETTDG